ncbi:signal peptidase II [Paraglaciecola hydrolytica]|uniref:Lipoprotein signal peptidase n=1 Tax=Paraglaciecola hydrolytica TaxID=1799789 RepID=A0A148KMI6_9ALTE|nr:signal peptidase II [Paraglaciecola hydrolytica]KXI27469.1 signal peptidase II [Paraglaciecola hydrolytica]
MSFVAKFRVIFIVSLLSILLDQLSKWWASHYLTYGSATSYFADILRIVYVENTGAFLGLGSGMSESAKFWIFVAAVGVVLLALVVFMFKSSEQNTYSIVSLSLIFSGGLSNFYDRAMNNGAVIDFLNMGFGSLRTGIFNVADMAIMLGVVMLLFAKSEVKKAE